MAFIDDVPAFFSTAEFAVDATLAGVAVVGIFDNYYEFEDMGGGVSAVGPAFTLPSSSVPSPVTGLALIVGSTTYKVIEPMPDGMGITKLRLRT